jgi:hypothetical protein
VLRDGLEELESRGCRVGMPYALSSISESVTRERGRGFAGVAVFEVVGPRPCWLCEFGGLVRLDQGAISQLSIVVCLLQMVH